MANDNVPDEPGCYWARVISSFGYKVEDSPYQPTMLITSRGQATNRMQVAALKRYDELISRAMAAERELDAATAEITRLQTKMERIAALAKVTPE